MSQQTNKTPLIITAVAVLAIIGGGIFYFTQGSDDSVSAQLQANAENAAEDMENSAEVGDVETSSGDASEQKAADDVANLEINEGEFVVEPGNPVVAKVDGVPITRLDVYRFIQTMPPNIQQLPASRVYPIAYDQVINTRLVQNKANKAEIDKTEEFKHEMEMAKQQIERDVFIREAVDKNIGESKLKDAYSRYVRDLPVVEERHARHILVDTEDKAKAVLEKLQKGGKFEELAASLSTGPTAETGGDLGYFAKKDMVPEFGNAVFSAKEPGVLPEPVKSQFGWHVIKVEDIRNRPNPTFAEMKPMLENQLRRETFEKLLAEWRDDAKVETFDINGKPLRDGADATGLLPEDKQPVGENKKGS